MLFTKNMQPITECGADLNGEGEVPERIQAILSNQAYTLEFDEEKYNLFKTFDRSKKYFQTKSQSRSKFVEIQQQNHAFQ